MKLPFSKRNWLLLCVAFPLTVLVGFLLYAFLVFVYYYVHELGHIASYFSYNLVQGIVPSVSITSWMNFPLIPLLSVPQRTTMLSGISSPLLAFGGTVSVLVFASLTSYFFYRSKKEKDYFLFVAAFLLIEFFNNYLCGTDNLRGRPFSICSNQFFNFVQDGAFYVLLILLVFFTYTKIGLRLVNNLNKKRIKS